MLTETSSRRWGERCGELSTVQRLRRPSSDLECSASAGDQTAARSTTVEIRERRRRFRKQARCAAQRRRATDAAIAERIVIAA